MESKILKEDHKDLIELSKSMAREDRLVAFLNHSRLIFRLYQAGKRRRHEK